MFTCWWSDTVASTLISIFFHLADDPSQVVKLRAELEKVNSLQDFDSLKSMAHLNGTINEALRLHPAVPSNGFRVTPPEGLTIAGQYIPGNVVVSAPRYSLGRRKWDRSLCLEVLALICPVKSCYDRPNDFVPERWYARPDMIKDDSGFAPFSIGASYSFRMKYPMSTTFNMWQGATIALGRTLQWCSYAVLWRGSWKTSMSHLRPVRTVWLCGEISKISSTRTRGNWNSCLLHEGSYSRTVRSTTETQVI